jgi:hypothetical protein
LEVRELKQAFIFSLPAVDNCFDTLKV